MASHSVAAEPRLSDVKSWLLVLNNEFDGGDASKVVTSNYDMVVIDHVSSQKDIALDRSPYLVNRFRFKPDGSRRLVIAYLNIGQAESYRRYWKKSWRVGSPDFIVGKDPDGWEGNFPVAYWRPEWQREITGDDGLIANIVAAGFDGVYLDWIGGFEDMRVLKAAKRDGVDSAQEMISWVRAVSADGKKRNPDFLVIAQNASGLLSDHSYLDAIDGVSHEDIWFTGADEGVEGDCPIPKTAEEVGSKAFLASLNAACRKSYLQDPASAMRFVGESEIVPKLQLAQAAGKSVFSVDYALKAENISYAMKRSRSFGFAPFVGARSLVSIVQEQAELK